MARRAKGGYDWHLTIRVRQTVRAGRVIISRHAREKAMAEGLNDSDVIDLLCTGVARSRRQRDELGSAIDGYKHFMISVTPAGRLFDVVFRFVRSEDTGEDELLILITLYRGEVR